ncbi:NADH-quinone oxidoreductase subunit N [Buchnera aphidicola (Acyrthosiphon lactucae)]|uniref:NADH-quinone oxidoreductase subunit N n=1 Tax=Buchnera aphidicola (Acyrthosiphon lactucae) TaxID=1241832 RepID=A0A4D6XLR7_9GAMM|nr:NADH-quinone oxidoreductase subunit N [Buchnera aphidicola]QCI17573.1 NADH-quinone oxidoreductase subunit N [Buchnera aphidicola (Acyrthosiphon lactucae)]
MTINLQQLTALLPVLITMFTAVTVMLSISYNRNHFFIAVFSILGFISAFCSLYFLIAIVPIDVTCLFHIDSYSILYIGMVIISSFCACIFAYSWLLKYPFNKEEFYLLIIISSLGAMSLIISNHMASLFINIELISLPIFGLIAYSSYQKYSLEASFKYIILSGVSSCFLLLGIAWIYSISGSLDFLSMHQVFESISKNEKLVVLFGTSMIFFALFFKLSIIPFHLWTPDIYQGSPTSVLSFFSTTSKIAIFSVLLHFFSNISNLDNKTLYFILLLITICSILVGNLMALLQQNIKRFFGYTSISQLGYLLIILFISKKNYLFSLEASAIYLCNYLFSNIACFGIINLISNSNKKNNCDLISSYQGLFWSQPLLSSIFTLVLLSFAGIPITLGFIAKFYILSIIIKEHLLIIGFSFIIGTILGLYCYLRIILNLYLNPATSCKRDLNVSKDWCHSPSGIVICISGIIILILGIHPNSLINLVKLTI